MARKEDMNPLFEKQMRARREAQAYNRGPMVWPKRRVQKQPNRYLPHTGAKERARYLTKGL